MPYRSTKTQFVAVDQDVGDRRVLEQRLERRRGRASRRGCRRRSSSSSWVLSASRSTRTYCETSSCTCRRISSSGSFSSAERLISSISSAVQPHLGVEQLVRQQRVGRGAGAGAGGRRPGRARASAVTTGVCSAIGFGRRSSRRSAFLDRRRGRRRRRRRGAERSRGRRIFLGGKLRRDTARAELLHQRVL